MYNQILIVSETAYQSKSNVMRLFTCTVMSEQGQWVEVQIKVEKEKFRRRIGAHYKYREVKEGELTKIW